MELQHLIEQVSILDYISQYADFKKNGHNYFTLCPFPNHQEKTPSFLVNPSDNVYYCFGCSSRGGNNIINFIQEYHKVPFLKAVNMLKAYSGVSSDVKINKPSAVLHEMKKFQPKVSKIKHFDRKELPYNYMNKFQDFKKSPWQDEGIELDLIRKYNIKYDVGQERIIIPIWDITGKLINVSGRATNPKWKELGQRKYTYYHKLYALDFFWGWHLALEKIKEKKEIIIVEGAKSVLKLYKWGYDNVVAISTSHLTNEQMILLLTIEANIIWALDKGVNPLEDKNIKKLQRFKNQFFIEDVSNLLSEKDAPVDKGLEVWVKLYSNAKGENNG